MLIAMYCSNSVLIQSLLYKLVAPFRWRVSIRTHVQGVWIYHLYIFIYAYICIYDPLWEKIDFRAIINTVCAVYDFRCFVEF